MLGIFHQLFSYSFLISSRLPTQPRQVLGEHLRQFSLKVRICGLRCNLRWKHENMYFTECRLRCNTIAAQPSWEWPPGVEASTTHPPPRGPREALARKHFSGELKHPRVYILGLSLKTLRGVIRGGLLFWILLKNSTEESLPRDSLKTVLKKMPVLTHAKWAKIL